MAGEDRTFPTVDVAGKWVEIDTMPLNPTGGRAEKVHVSMIRASEGPQGYSDRHPQRGLAQEVRAVNRGTGMTDEAAGDELSSSGVPAGISARGSVDDSGRLQCQFCCSYAVDRLFLASTGVDACECQACGARWEEERASGRYLGRGSTDTVITNRRR
jgi:hypothetical protein